MRVTGGSSCMPDVPPPGFAALCTEHADHRRVQHCDECSLVMRANTMTKRKCRAPPSGHMPPSTLTIGKWVIHPTLPAPPLPPGALQADLTLSRPPVGGTIAVGSC